MTRLLSDARFRIGACLLALAVLAGLGVLTKTPAAGPQALATEDAGRTVVNRTALSCPAPGAGSKVSTTVDAVAPALPAGTPTAEGRTSPLSIGPLSPSEDPLATVRTRGRLGSTPQTAEPAPLAVRGAGPLAAGAVATTTATATEGVNRGMASIPCQPPGSDLWFVGASAAPGRRDVLVLTNLDTVNAQVDVSVFGTSGRQDVPAARGIVVPARGTAEVFLSTTMPKQRDVALRVVSTGGRVAAAVRDNVTSAGTPAGVDWLSPSTPPATKVVVPAIAPGAGARSLTVVNPGELQATATITVHGRSGAFKPAGRTTLTVPAGGVKVVRLEPALHGEATAVTVESDDPLTASVRMVDAKNVDFASVGATEPLTGPAYLVLPPHSEPAVLQVTAPGKAAGARFELRDDTGKLVHSDDVDIVPGATAAVTLKARARATYLTVAPRKGSVVAGVTLTPPAKDAGDLVRVAAWQLTTSAVFRAQLGAEPDVSAALN